MKRVALAAALVVLATVPLWVSGTFYVNIASQILLYAIFALGVNVLAGYAGLVSLGHAGLFGIAAYTGARMLTSGAGHLGSLKSASQGVFQITPPLSNEISGSGANDTSSVDKIIKAVVTCEYAID